MEAQEAAISFLTGTDECELRLSGPLGVANAEELRQTAIELCGYRKNVRVDWSGASQIDASIVQVLLSLHAGLGIMGRSLSLPHAPPAIRNWLLIAGLAEWMGSPEAMAESGEGQ
ncbi:MAG TPA: STAS domain-containing protein [Bryobacteraceae bacterium]|nr:STAS domain-containing protein [Bryobacteraceae bacterium]